MTREEAIYELGSANQGYLLKDMINEIYDDLEHRTCESCRYRMNKGKNAELCLHGDTREFMWIPKHIFNSGCNKMDRLKEI